MERHHKWGLALIAIGLALEILFPFILIADTALIVIGVALILFGGMKRRAAEVKNGG